MEKIGSTCRPGATKMIKIFYAIGEGHETEVADLVYVLNLLKGIDEKVCHVDFGNGIPIYYKINHKAAKFGRKGLKSPKETFTAASGNLYLDSALFIICNGEVEYYWHRNLWKPLEVILQKGLSYLDEICRY